MKIKNKIYITNCNLFKFELDSIVKGPTSLPSEFKILIRTCLNQNITEKSKYCNKASIKLLDNILYCYRKGWYSEFEKSTPIYMLENIHTLTIQAYYEYALTN